MYQLLHAGPLRVRYEDGFLRYLSLGQEEVVRMIYFAVRDRHWQTARLTLSNEVADQTDDSFRISYNWQTNDLGIRMTGKVTMLGEADGTISVDFYARALTAFHKNRIGICVLHPLDGVVGQPCQIGNPDGSRTPSQFPIRISPRQPFLDIRSMRWQPTSGHDLQLDFEGDVFETEDQRNWTDASLKTYSTPLRIPFPVPVSTGDEIRQRVVFRVLRLAEKSLDTPLQNKAKPAGRRKAPGRATAPIQPRVGLGQRSDGKPLTVSEAARLRKLNLAHLRADVLLSQEGWQTRLRQAVADADLLGVPLELALFFGPEPSSDLESLRTVLDQHRVAPGTVMLFDAATLGTSDELLHQVLLPVREAWPTVPIGGGTDSFFADFNRNPFDYSRVDFVTYAISPQVHAFDDLTLLENIDGQRATVETARHLTGGKPIHISPITLLPRYITTAQAHTGRLSPPADPRQTTGFGATWTRQSLLTLARAGVSSVTYYETHGPLGLLDGDSVFPVYETGFAL